MSQVSFGGLYKDICRGYSETFLKEKLFIKHFTSVDLSQIEEYEFEAKESYKKKGALSQADLIVAKIKEGSWSKENEDKLAFLERNMETMRKSRRKATTFSQIVDIEEQIEIYEKEYVKLSTDKSRLLNLSMESLAISATTELVLHLAFFRDSSFEHPAFFLEEVTNFSSEEMNECLFNYRAKTKDLTQDNIRKMSVLSRVRTAIKSSRGAESFFGKRGFDLSFQQISLFEYSKYFSDLIEKIEDITEEEKNDPDEIERIFILQMNKDKRPEGANHSKLTTAFSKAKGGQ